MIIDTHAHIDFETDEDIEKIISKAKDFGVEKIIIPGVEPDNFNRILELTQKYKNVFGAVGIHPEEAKKYSPDAELQIKDFLKNDKILAVGEIGLDYYWDRSYIDLQKEIFIKQVNIAQEVGKSIIVHDREAHQDSFEILKNVDTTVSPVIMHCFSGSVEFAKECIKKGFYIAVGGVLTFKNAKKLKETVRQIPLEYILTETDCPYMTPVPHRGEKNEPAYTKFVAEEIARLKEIDIKTVEKITSANAIKAFKMDTK